MKITWIAEKINLNQVMDISVDVHKRVFRVGREIRRVDLRARQVHRAPLPATGFTSCAVASCATSEGITPPSTLILAHAPDQKDRYQSYHEELKEIRENFPALAFVVGFAICG